MAADFLTPETLWPRIQAATTHGLACGALQPIPTEFTLLPGEPVPFLVRVLANITRKAAATPPPTPGQPRLNPFLPYDRDLWVGHFSATHTALLNKYNVVDHHLLIITRHYESQDTWLTLGDFTALGIALQAIDGLGFYNGGQRAGASQHHKHLQVVPLPLAPLEVPLPLAAIMDPLCDRTPPNTPFSLGLPFQAWGLRLDLNWPAPTAPLGPTLLAAYHTLTQSLAPFPQNGPPPYNLLVTRCWMVLIPRRQESHQGISVNALGYAGSLLVKDTPTLTHLQSLRPLPLLTAVGIPAQE